MTRLDYLRAEGFSDAEALIIAFNECFIMPKPRELLDWPGVVGEFFREKLLAEIIEASFA